MFKIGSLLGMVYAFNLSSSEAGAGVLSEFEVSLVSRIARQTLPRQTNQLNNKNTSKQMVPQSHQPHNHM